MPRSRRRCTLGTPLRMFWHSTGEWATDAPASAQQPRLPVCDQDGVDGQQPLRQHAPVGQLLHRAAPVNRQRELHFLAIPAHMNLERGAAVFGECRCRPDVLGREPRDVGGEHGAPERLVARGRMAIEELRGPTQIALGLTGAGFGP